MLIVPNAIAITSSSSFRNPSAGPITSSAPSSMAEHASQLYARNVASLLELMTGEDGALALNWDDEVIKGACITRDGEIVHEGARKATA